LAAPQENESDKRAKESLNGKERVEEKSEERGWGRKEKVKIY
jgi:hypothetical protein